MTEKQYNEKLTQYEDKIVEIQNKLLIKYKKIIEEEVRDLCLQAVSDFYADYPDPMYYGRTGDLKNAFKIIVDIKKESFEIKFDSKFMIKKHRANNSYIFDISFMNGWHGGADHIKKSKEKQWGVHPDKNSENPSPYWRTPHPSKIKDGETPYNSWGRKAEIAEISPYEQIMSSMPDLESSINMRMKSEYTKKMKPIISGIKKTYNDFYNN